MATPSPTSLPTSSGTTGSEDDDSFNVYTAITSLKWNDIWTVLLTCLVGSLFMIVFVVSKFPKRSCYHLVYCPRFRWEREMATKHGNYTPLARPKRTAAPWWWIYLVATIPEAELLKHVGVEMYVMLRFIRMCLKISVFGTLIIMPIGISAYGTADASGDTSKYSRLAWFRFTMANLEQQNKGRIWTAALLMYVVTIYAVGVVALECFAFVELKQKFYFTTPPSVGDLVKSEQQMRSVMMERLPLELRSSERLKEFWDAVLPGKVHSAVVCYETKELAKLNQCRENVALLLERCLLYKKRTGEEPIIHDDSLCGLGLCWARSCRHFDEDWETRRHAQGTSAITYYQGRLTKLNAEFQVARTALLEAREDEMNGMEQLSQASLLATQQRQIKHIAAAEKHTGTGLERIAHALGVGTPKFLVDETTETNVIENAATATVSIAKAILAGHKHCDTGFVTFKDYTSASMLRQMQLAPRPLSVEAHEGVPDENNIVWNNVPESLDASIARQNLASVLVYVIAFYWSLFISFCYVVASYKTLKRWGIVPNLNSLPQSQETVVRYFFSIAPVGLISIGLALLPLLLNLLAEHYEKMKLRSEIQLSVLERNFFLQMINLWLTVVAGSIWDALKNIINRPSAFFKFIGKTLPTVSVYFVELVVIRTFISNFWEFSRILPWLRLRAAKLAAGGALTARDHRNNLFLQPEMMYGSVYTSHLMVLTILFLFAVIAPMSYPFCVAYFLIAYFVYTHNALHVYVPKYDSGGLFFFPVIAYLLGGLAATQVTLVGYLVVLQAWGPAGFVFLLPIATYAFSRHIQTHYAPACQKAAVQLTLSRDTEYATASPEGTPPIDDLVTRFDPFLFRQPDLTDADAVPHDLPSMGIMDDANDDADFDDLGDVVPDPPSTLGGTANSPLVPPPNNMAISSLSSYGTLTSQSSAQP